MTKVVLVVAMLMFGCVDSETTTTECGPRPNRPGRSVLFANEQAIMSVADYIALRDWEVAVVDWSVCVLGE